MLDYKSLIKACRNLKLDPTKFGDNPFMDSHPVQSFKEPFDFGEINFPEKQLVQILRIGQIIYNLVSQTPTSHVFVLTKNKGKEKYQRYENIKKILPLLVESLDFWLKSGLAKCKSDKNLVVLNGRVFEVDPKQTAKMDGMNDYMKEVHRDFLYKEAMSEQSASQVILNA